MADCQSCGRNLTWLHNSHDTARETAIKVRGEGCDSSKLLQLFRRKLSLQGGQGLGHESNYLLVCLDLGDRC